MNYRIKQQSREKKKSLGNSYVNSKMILLLQIYSFMLNGQFLSHPSRSVFLLNSKERSPTKETGKVILEDPIRLTFFDAEI